MRYDFSGWATRNDLKCSDGRTIRKDAFKSNDGQTVPLVWNHQHNDAMNVLGHALLENREDGVYAYCTFNETESGRNAKLLVEHGDVSALSIYANQLKQQGADVLHGAIREVSLVLAGANPGAYIDSVMCHGRENEEEAIIYTGEEISLCVRHGVTGNWNGIYCDILMGIGLYRAVNWWLRSPNSSNNNNAYNVNTDGSVNNNNVYNGNNCARPALAGKYAEIR